MKYTLTFESEKAEDLESLMALADLVSLRGIDLADVGSPVLAATLLRLGNRLLDTFGHVSQHTLELAVHDEAWVKLWQETFQYMRLAESKFGMRMIGIGLDYPGKSKQ